MVSSTARTLTPGASVRQRNVAKLTMQMVGYCPVPGSQTGAFQGASGLIIMMQVPTHTEEHRKEQMADGVDVWLVFVRVRSLVVDPIQQDDDHEENRHANDAKQPVASEATESICDP